MTNFDRIKGYIRVHGPPGPVECPCRIGSQMHFATQSLNRDLLLEVEAKRKRRWGAAT